MEFHQLSVWSPESGESPADNRVYAGHTSPIFSPLPSEYASFLENFGVEFTETLPVDPPLAGNKKTQIEEENEEDGGVDEGGLDNAKCKNLLSERNRRRRLNQQLMALRSLVPCISKMDKRSILMDAATYLQGLHQEIDQLKSELAAQEGSESSTTSSEISMQSPDGTPPPEEASSHQHHIFQLDTEELDDRTFTIKVVFKKARGAPAQVQRMIESLGYTLSQMWTHEIDPQQMITTSFIHMKKQISLSAEMLKTQASKAALTFGFDIDLDD